MPIYHAAKELQLPLHQIDTFRGWSPPLTSNGNLINLIVAVSFGLLVPPRLLNGAKYGGLNVHPSLLPQYAPPPPPPPPPNRLPSRPNSERRYRGAAPIHHTLLDACARTGVTLQTLHPSRMDHGQILAQTPAPGIPVAPADEDCVARLTATLASLGASMLVEGLEKRLFVPPVEDLAPTLEPRDPTTLKHAHKIAPEDRHIDWTTWSAAQILRYGRVIGPLWSYVEEASSHTKHRCIWPTGFKSVEAFVREDCEAGDCVPPRLDGLVCRPGIGYVSPRRDYVMLGTADAKFLVARTATLAGLKKGVPIGDAFVKTGVLPPGIWQEARKSGEAIAVSKPFT